MTEVGQKQYCSVCKSVKTSKFCGICRKETPSDLNIKVYDEIKVRDTLVLRNMFGTAKTFISELLSGWFPSAHPKLQDGVNKSRIIDRGKDEYHEVIKKADTNEVIRDIHEPLNQHQSYPSVPTFVIGKPNLPQDTNTKLVRGVINDAFGLSKELICLNCTEYAQYKVKEKIGVDIKWPADRPRHGGRWASIFEKNNMYKVLGEPKPNCAMSFANPGFNAPFGHVAFVEEVMPDGSVKISEANWPKDGIYNERVISRNDWQNKYQAKFIDFR